MAKSTYWLPLEGLNGASALPVLSQELLGHFAMTLLLLNFVVGAIKW